jgi:acetolactate decarboxylase
MSALLDGVYDGDMTIGELLSHGEFGLGTFDALDGEMVVTDGVCYQLRDGAARVATHDQLTPFAVVTTFVPMITSRLPDDASREQVVDAIRGLVRSENYLYAVRITGEFAWVRTRTAARQAKPYPPLREQPGANR